MDWLWSVAGNFILLTMILEANAVRINPFTGLPEASYDPVVADYSVNQGSYLPNLPMTSIFPLMSDDVNAMMGLSSLKTPFVNPLMASVQQASLARPPPNMNKAKNARNNNNNQKNRNPQQPNRGRGVTLDVRGGGYKVENQGPKPYKSPVAESSVRDQQRYNNNNGRKPGGQSNPNGSNGPRNRKPNQRPRGPNMKNPYYNMKFESSSPSMPPNVEFVSPENVLPFHPRMYKQFLQQNKQFASYLQNMRKQNAFKSPSQNFGNFQNNGYNPSKPSGSKVTRNRVNPIAQQSQLSSLPNFPFSGGSPDFASQLGFLQQQSPDKTPNTPSFMDIFKQDPSLIASLSQTPEGQAYLAQMYQQQQQTKNNPRPRGPFGGKPQQHSITPSFPSSGMSSFQTGMKLPSDASTQYNPNFFGQGQPDGIQNPPKIPTNEAEFQQMMMNFHQTMQQLSPLKQFQQATNGPSGIPTYKENISPPSPNYANTQYDQVKTNPFGGDYPYMPSQQYQEPQSQPSTFGKNINTPYDTTNFQSSYQASQSHIKSQDPPVDIGGYSMPPFSPMDPLSSLENGSPGVQDYYSFQTGHHKAPTYSNGYHSGATALHEISPYSEEKTAEPSSTNEAKSGYMTPEQLFAPQSTGLQSEGKFALASESSSATAVRPESSEPEASSTILEHEGSERAALHLPEEVSIFVASQTDNPFVYEFTESIEPLSYEEEEKTENPSSERSESRHSSGVDSESDEKLHESIQEFQKLLTKAPKNNFMAEPTESTLTTKVLESITTTTRPSSLRKTPDSEESKNHKNSYMFQYAPSEKSISKSTPTWHARKPNASKYQLPIPDAKPKATTPSTTTTLTTTVPPPTNDGLTTATSQASYSTHTSFYHEPDTPICARYNNLTYCLQDPEYPKDQIKEAIEKNRHPLDHFLVDISASSNIVDDGLDKLFDNSVPLQSTAVSYSFEGKAIAPSGDNNGTGEAAAGCASNVHYAKPLRAINTAGLWKIIVNVEFEETGANYTQTVRIEECSHANGFVATCGTETISACLQQYKLYRLLAWENHRGFYIDAFLLPISCFCGSQQS